MQHSGWVTEAVAAAVGLSGTMRTGIMVVTVNRSRDSLSTFYLSDFVSSILHKSVHLIVINNPTIEDHRPVLGMRIFRHIHRTCMHKKQFNKDHRVYTWACLWTQKWEMAPTQSEEGGGSHGHQYRLCLLWIWKAEGLPSRGGVLRLAKTTEVIRMQGPRDKPGCHQPTFPYQLPYLVPGLPSGLTHSSYNLQNEVSRASVVSAILGYMRQAMLKREAADRKGMTLGTRLAAAMGLLPATQKDKGVSLWIRSHSVLHCKL